MCLTGNDQAIIFAPQFVPAPLNSVSLNSLAAALSRASAAGYQALHRADRLLATANKDRRTTSQTLRKDAMWCGPCGEQSSLDEQSPRQTRD
jgi:hypothetical protein